ncbi:MAG: peptidoglycan DD-metalloendopeptidase family protein [Clostridia bacterium]|nr:peptidoglycan DD-metalloendopeptidase family protein [Clostridia bacterium]
MRNGKNGRWRRIMCIILAAVMLIGLVSSALIIMVNAASSKEIEKDLVALREEQNKLKKEANELKSEIAENQKTTQTLVEKKADIDRQMDVTRQTIENLNAQIQSYSLLISQKQEELDASLAEEAELNAQYKTRIRSMEETGKVSYWSILFGAKSFSDLLGKVDMIREIAESDQMMLKKIAAMTKRIEAEREDLEQQMQELDAAKAELMVQQDELTAQRAESDELILQMAAEYAAMSQEYMDYLALEEEMSAQIKKAETDYFNALAKEEKERLAKLNAQNNNKAPAKTGSGSSGSSSGSSGGSSSGGWLYPLGYSVPITCAYGWRIHPLTGNKSWHTGIDLGAGEGSAIYASKSGTVTSATYNEAYGNCVTINHGDGYSSLYAHMTNYIVSAGSYVKQGDVIGYVGTTGYSTGPHLHFTIYYNGGDVNPLSYISVP